MLPAKDPPLPKLRDDLTLVEGATTRDGEPSWLIHDALQHRHFQIDAAAHEILAAWGHCKTVDELVTLVQKRGELDICGKDVGDLIDFVSRNKLIACDREGAWKALAGEHAMTRQSLFSWIVHNYLFFKVPLCNPQSFLYSTLPALRNVVGFRSLSAIAILGIVGLYLVSRQWDAFVATFQYAFTWEGAALTFLTLAFVKAAHEMGHAYVAAHYGCRVPTIGLAFMMLAPMLYSDVSDTWRLKERKARLLVSLAGVLVEFGIACLAIFAWSFMPEGPLRSATFFLATVSLVTSLAINLNPLMRFDGYYLLSDWLGVENLQSRSFSLARWKMREWLFDLKRQPPELLPPRLRITLVLYAWAVWIYRFGLYTGISLVVYHFFFKALGIAFFMFEILYFIAMPIFSEIKEWHKIKISILRSKRARLTMTASCLAVVGFVVPWSTRVEIPAIIEPKDLVRIFPTRAAKIQSIQITSGQQVVAGQTLLVLSSPDIDKDIALAETKLRLAKMQYARRMADVVDREASLELEGTLASLTTRIAGLRDEQSELIVKAPMAGKVVELNAELHAGRWVNPREMVAAIGVPGQLVARGYVSENDLFRIKEGYAGVFVPDAAQRPSMTGVIDEISAGGANQVDILDLASQFGGRIAVQPDDKRRLVPVVAQFPVRVTLATEEKSVDLINRGVVIVSGSRESLAARVWRHSISVLIRESGF
jgi:putative peptide zinc metalloprotease protein